MEGSLRHAQLDVAGAPKIRETFVRGVPVWIGSLMHLDIHRMLREAGVRYDAEVDLTPGMPAGWGGTGDILAHGGIHECTLIDVKSTNGRAVKYLLDDGAKPEHIKQASAYWHAAVMLGYGMTPKIGMYYVPKEDNAYASEPLLIWFDPIPKDELWPAMEARRALVDAYLTSMHEPDRVVGITGDPDLDKFLTPALEPVQERIQKCYFDKATETWDVKLAPHWSTSYCQFPDELCDCRSQGYTKIGMYDVDGVTYIPRSGYEEIAPVVAPA
jgi:hypothetical protein